MPTRRFAVRLRTLLLGVSVLSAVLAGGCGGSYGGSGVSDPDAVQPPPKKP